MTPDHDFSHSNMSREEDRMLCYDAEIPRQLRRDQAAEQAEQRRRKRRAPQDASRLLRRRAAPSSAQSFFRPARDEAALATSP